MHLLILMVLEVIGETEEGGSLELMRLGPCWAIVAESLTPKMKIERQKVCHIMPGVTSDLFYLTKAPSGQYANSDCLWGEV